MRAAFLLMDRHIFEVRTEDGEPAGIWHICIKVGGEWIQDPQHDGDFDSYEAAERHLVDTLRMICD